MPLSIVTPPRQRPRDTSKRDWRRVLPISPTRKNAIPGDCADADEKEIWKTTSIFSESHWG